MQKDNIEELFIDLETTGLDKNKHMIRQIAAEFHVNGEKKDEFFVEIKTMPSQNTSISLEALRVTGENLESVLTKGEDEAQAVMKFVDWLMALSEKRLNIIGHNPRFDIGFIETVFQKYNIEKLDQVINYTLEDTMGLAKTLKKAGILDAGRVSLGELANSLGISPAKGEKLHNAATDVRVTVKVYRKLVKMLQEMAEGAGVL